MVFALLRLPTDQRPWWLQLYGVPPWWPWQPQLEPPVIDLREEPGATGPATPCVLVVDDEPDIRFWLRMTLQPKGWRVEEAPSAEAALLHFERETPDVLVIDQRMGGMTGLECAALLREDGYSRPIVLLSALIDTAAVGDADRLDVLPVSKVDHGSLLALLDAIHRELRPAESHLVDIPALAAFSR